jgi:hypothetical protein
LTVRCFARTLVFVLSPFMATSASAQRRATDSTARGLELALPSAIRVGEVVVRPGRYRVSVADAVLAFASPESMVTVASAPAVQSAAAEAVAEPRVGVRDLGKTLEITVLSQDEVFTLTVDKVLPQAKSDTLVELAGKSEAAVQPAMTPPDTAAALDAALARLLPSLGQCGDKAQQNRWATDDARFVKCVCPLVEKWRLPKAAAAQRVHRSIAKAKNGVSLTVGPDGRAGACRVWSGARSPEETAPAVLPAEVAPMPAAPAQDAPAPR